MSFRIDVQARREGRRLYTTETPEKGEKQFKSRREKAEKQ
jgi:hypothetical protein